MGKNLIFVSYATKDAETFHIKQVCEQLAKKEEIENVLYWQEDMHDNIIQYMNDNIGKSDIIVVFCSPNALNSKPVTDEWMAAKASNKPIIPVFVSTDHIPPLLKSLLGIQYDPFDLNNTVENIYRLILKKAKPDEKTQNRQLYEKNSLESNPDSYQNPASLGSPVILILKIILSLFPPFAWLFIVAYKNSEPEYIKFYRITSYLLGFLIILISIIPIFVGNTAWYLWIIFLTPIGLISILISFIIKRKLYYSINSWLPIMEKKRVQIITGKRELIVKATNRLLRIVPMVMLLVSL